MTRPPTCAGGHRGFALVTVVLLMIGLAVLATGLVFAAAQQAAMTGSAHDVARARHAAEAALQVAIDDWVSAERSLDPTGGSTRLVEPTAFEPGVVMSAAARRLSGELFLLVGNGSASRAGTAAIEQRTARVVRSLDADRIGRGLDAALVTGAATIAAGAIVDGAGADSPARDSVAAALCARWPGAGAALRAPPDSVTVSAAAATSGSPAFVADSAATRFLTGLGFLDTGTLAASARPLDRPTITPAPVLDGQACDTIATEGWGAPAGPCASHWPLLHAGADLALEGGYGQGILLADGDLVLDGGVHWRGLVLARGTVIIRDARVEGILIATRLHMQGGYVSLDRCAIASALVASAVTRGAHPPVRSWLPWFD